MLLICDIEGGLSASPGKNIPPNCPDVSKLERVAGL